ncbi:hypothetical protein HY478_03440 [Candidatus Uhrbacteria bacterium]|nr:hypothetical protein [Candidatus Uhrbacteria bacterium]
MPPGTPQQTFIPREAPAPIRHARGKGMGDLLVLLSIVLFVASSALAAGVFLYGEYLKSSASSKLSQLERAKAAFEPSLIHELSRLDDRMRGAGDVLGRHVSLSAFFNMLEATTIETISFNSLRFEAADLQRINLRMDGVAASVNSIALQADLFSKGGMIASPIFSNIDREADGVHFSLSATINPSAINYAQLVNGLVQVPQETTSPFEATVSPESAAESQPEEGEPL